MVIGLGATTEIVLCAVPPRRADHRPNSRRVVPVERMNRWLERANQMLQEVAENVPSVRFLDCPVFTVWFAILAQLLLIITLEAQGTKEKRAEMYSPCEEM